jgi:hypothetical protein
MVCASVYSSFTGEAEERRMISNQYPSGSRANAKPFMRPSSGFFWNLTPRNCDLNEKFHEVFTIRFQLITSSVHIRSHKCKMTEAAVRLYIAIVGFIVIIIFSSVVVGQL